MNDARISRKALVFLTLAVTLFGSAPSAHANECELVIESHDTGLNEMSLTTDFGRSIGQSFYAPDVLLRKLVVWVVPQTPTGPGLLVHIAPTGLSQEPDARHKFAENAVMQVLDAAPGQIKPMVAEFDPPLRLPAKGHYAFLLSSCTGTGAAYVVHDPKNGYERGVAWATHRGGGCDPILVDGSEDHADVLFRAEFCHVAATPTRKTTWGKIKAIYR